MKQKLFFFCLSILLVVLPGCAGKKSESEETKKVVPPAFAAEADVTYKDGSYHYEGVDDGEGYQVRIDYTVTDGKLSDITWDIYDTKRDRVFDETYEEVFEGQELYQEQCRTDLIGYNSYGDALLKAQESQDKLTTKLIFDVDSISGATWTYNLLKTNFIQALKLAE